MPKTPPDYRDYLPYLAALTAPDDTKEDIVRTLFMMMQYCVDQGLNTSPNNEKKDKEFRVLHGVQPSILGADMIRCDLSSNSKTTRKSAAKRKEA